MRSDEPQAFQMARDRGDRVLAAADRQGVMESMLEKLNRVKILTTALVKHVVDFVSTCEGIL